jgi:hypothetical protein
LTPAQILAAALDAAGQAGTAHLSLEMRGNGAAAEAAMNMAPHGGSATLTHSSMELNYLVANHDVYLSGNEQFWSPAGPVALDLARVDGRWIWAPADAPRSGSVAGLVGTRSVVDDLLALSGKLTRPSVGARTGTTITLQGTLPRGAINIGAAGGARATLSVSTTAPYYPVRLAYTSLSSVSVVLSFADWGDRAGPS